MTATSPESCEVKRPGSSRVAFMAVAVGVHGALHEFPDSAAVEVRLSKPRRRIQSCCSRRNVTRVRTASSPSALTHRGGGYHDIIVSSRPDGEKRIGLPRVLTE